MGLPKTVTHNISLHTRSASHVTGTVLVVVQASQHILLTVY
jgi:hypothetical protein